MFVLSVALIAVVTALACALPGTFVVLRRDSMLVDGIAHAVFPGIVVGYLITRDLNSPLLMLGAALAGLLVVLGADWLRSTRMISGDAPLGLIFPALFALGIILTSSSLTNVHLDTHVVLVGDLNLAAFAQLSIGGVTLGPTYLWVMLAVLALNAAFIVLFYPQLHAATFDPELTRVMGLPTRSLNAVFMFLVSLTVTAAFNGAGALLVIALMITPAATAQIFATRLGQMIRFSLLFAAVGALAGFGVAWLLDAPTSPAMAVFYGLMFAVVLVAKRLSGNRASRARATPPTPAAPGGRRPR